MSWSQKETITLASHYRLCSENHPCLQDWTGPFHTGIPFTLSQSSRQGALDEM